jgi:asparagine synthase (glutamine-hydrolysing)
MVHRGPDDSGVHFAAPVCLGMTRLSIIDLSRAGRQPMTNEDGSVWLVSNGEIYNFRELRRWLLERGHRFQSRTDTEVIIHLYEELGQDCIQRLRGMFAFALWDGREQKLWLARDRLGIKPLYYTEMNGLFLFASELKALLRTGLVPIELNPEAVDHYLSFGAVPSPLTIMQGIYCLPPGHMLLVSEGGVRQERYWQLDFTPLRGHPRHFYVQRTRELLEESIRLHQVSDVPIGAFLSGGLDSSAVVALMGRITGQPVRTFSVGFVEGPECYDERSHARRVAQALGTEHTEVIVRGQDVLEALPHIFHHMDQPTVDGVNSYFVSRAARQGVTVALSGLGGDELFGGYPSFVRVPRLMPYVRAWNYLPSPARHLLQRWGSRLSVLAGGETPLRRLRHLVQLESLAAAYAGTRVYFWPAEKKQLYTPEFRARLDGSVDSIEWLNRYLGRAGGHPVQQLTRLELHSYMSEMLLRDTDCMSMAHSLEVRVPLVDHKLVEFVVRIPPEIKLANGGKSLLVEAIRDLLPLETLNRPKHGFEFPMGYWVQHQLRGVVYQALDGKFLVEHGILQQQPLREIRRQVQNRLRSYHTVWLLVALELWLQSTSALLPGRAST